MLLGLPGLATPVIHVKHVLDRLVAMSVVAHIHHLHLTDLVDREAIVAVVEERRDCEHAVQHGDIFLIPAHQVDESLGIVEDAPGIVEAISLREVPTPFERAERTLEGPVEVLADHQFVLRIVEILVVHRGLRIRGEFLLTLSESLAESVDAPVVISIFEGPGGVLVDLNIARDIAQAVVIFPSHPAGGTYFRMDSVGSMSHSLP